MQTVHWSASLGRIRIEPSANLPSLFLSLPPCCPFVCYHSLEIQYSLKWPKSCVEGLKHDGRSEEEFSSKRLRPSSTEPQEPNLSRYLRLSLFESFAIPTDGNNFRTGLEDMSLYLNSYYTAAALPLGQVNEGNSC